MSHDNTQNRHIDTDFEEYYSRLVSNEQCHGAASFKRFCHNAIIRINLQEVRGQAKPYQLRQVVEIIEKYGLTLDSEQGEDEIRLECGEENA